MTKKSGKKTLESLDLAGRRQVIELWKKVDEAESKVVRLELELAERTFERDRLAELVDRAGPAVEEIRDEALSRFRELEARLEELTRRAD